MLLLLALPSPASAQISPGPLSAPHADLEGSTRCLDCHTPREGVSAAKCLDCHGALAARIEAGRGFHAREEAQDCETCHVEHHGREFELVWWGDAGMDSFDHGRAGFALEGAHARLACRDCHRPLLLRDAAALERGAADPDSTFLGLGTACLDCHRDEHRGQLAARACTDCHSQEAWKPAGGFDHGQTRYPLTGAHRRVACGECHPRVAAAEEAPAAAGTGARRSDEGGSGDRGGDGGRGGRGGPLAPDDATPGAVRFTGLAFASCADCHRDPHAGRLGGTCTSCHTTAGWRSVAMTAGFDHDRTRFPLAGAHRGVDCAACHGPRGAFRRPPFAACTDCHVDAHLGQLRDRGDRGACTACHTEDAFRPPRFDLEDHDLTDYPLQGAHRAVPCVACHRPLDPAEVARLARAAGVDRSRLARALDGHPPLAFDLAHAACTDCHDDPHRGEADRFARPEGCTACHAVDAWRPATFDHARTGWPLAGRHRSVACADCHPPLPGAPADTAAALRFTATPTGCPDCHADPHRGQLAGPGGVTTCTQCHSVEGWKPAAFDHDRDARFRLEGAHRRVECGECHREEVVAGGVAVRYKPLPVTCEGCHAGGAPGEG